ncbi:MAG TPA: tetratricopeptide repeat protein [Streptosporangiaceae bacterium]
MNQPRDFSLHGAVDLGARQAAAQRRQRAAEQAQATPGQAGAQATSIDVTDETFTTDVINRSQTVPVVVDLWADWCGPCKQLSPILEKLAAEANGAFVLAKVDADANPQVSAALSQVLQSTSIPMVVAFVAGQIANAFIGAVPEAQARQWVGQLLQVAAQYGMQADGAGLAEGDGAEVGEEAAAPGQLPGYPGADPGTSAVFDEAQQAMERGDMDAAAAAFEKVLAANPGDPVATMGLGQVELIRRVEAYDQAAVRREAAQRPDDATAQARMADLDLATGRIEESFDRLLGTIKRTSGDERDKARQHLVELFGIFPPGDSLVAKARARLSSLLF